MLMCRVMVLRVCCAEKWYFGQGKTILLFELELETYYSKKFLAGALKLQYVSPEPELELTTLSLQFWSHTRSRIFELKM